MKSMFLLLLLVMALAGFSTLFSLPPAIGPALQGTVTPSSAYLPFILKNPPLPLPTPFPPRPTPTASPTPTGLPPTPTATSTPTTVSTPFCDMECRLSSVIRALNQATACEAIDGALDEGMEILYGGLRPLPSKDLLEQTRRADAMVRAAEIRLANTLESFTGRAVCPAQQDRALDLKLFIEQLDEVAQAVGAITSLCGNGDSLAQPPCDELRSILDEETGRENDSLAQPSPAQIAASYSVKLRSPVVPPWIRHWEEDVRVTQPIPTGQCVVIPKETKGLMLRLHFDRVIIVTDPWVSVFNVPRGTPLPIWRLEWVASQYLKEWNFCNPAGTGIVKTVTQRVVQDIPLNFFWRFYRKDP